MLILVIGLFFFSPACFSAVCVHVDTAGYLVPSLDPMAECTGFALLDSSEWLLSGAMWTLPSYNDLAYVWLAGFSIPVTLFLISWCIGSLLSFFRS